ncbi:FhaA domain-containing protein [Psychromicrobium sp. YIM B11713]|uniref:FhaA domain-containing protein n=1 Tax=Psychromicrobium sp. YIM B11713 TaxID=3145233 RepID=UPI00374FD8E6
MGILDNVERGLEKAVRGVFSRGSKSQVQPVEIASALRREMDDKSMTLAAGRTLAPNVFDTRLSEADFERARSWGVALAEELCDVAIRHARSQGYTLQGPVRVSFTQDLELKAGNFEIISNTQKSDGQPQQQAQRAQPSYPGQRPSQAPRPPARPAVPAQAAENLQAVLDIDGQRYSLNASSIVLGRSSEADILVDDTGVSRQHLEIRIEPGRATAVDLGSTNGSFVNGSRVNGSLELSDGAMISIGRTRMTFRWLPVKGGRG